MWCALCALFVVVRLGPDRSLFCAVPFVELLKLHCDRLRRFVQAVLRASRIT